jgi:hypothetical protein
MDKKTQSKMIPKQKDLGEVEFKIKDVLDNAKTKQLKLPLVDS